MRRCALVFLALILAPAAGLWAGDLPLPVAAKLLLIISKGGGENGRIATKHAEMAAEFPKVGGEVNAASRIVWATSIEEIRMGAMQRKCVVVNDPKFISQGAAIALYEEGGKPKIAINQKAVQASGVALSDAIIKVAMQ